MELSPVASVGSPMSSHSPFNFPMKQKDDEFKDNVYLIQDLSHSYQSASQSNFKEVVDTSKLEYKAKQTGYRWETFCCILKFLYKLGLQTKLINLYYNWGITYFNNMSKLF